MTARERPRSITPLTLFALELQGVRADLDSARDRIELLKLADRTRAHARRQRLSALVTALVALLVCAVAVYAALHLDASVGHQLGPALERALPVGLVDGGLGLTTH